MRDIGLRFFDTNGDEITWDAAVFPVFDNFMGLVWYFYVTNKQRAMEFFKNHLRIKEADAVECYESNVCFCRADGYAEWYTIDSQIDFLIEQLSEERRNYRKIVKAISSGNFAG